MYISSALFVLLCTIAAQSVQAAPAPPNSGSDVDLRDEPNWGASFSNEAWGLTERDFDVVDDEDFDFGNSTNPFNDGHDLETRAKKKKVGLAFDYASPLNGGSWKSSNVRAAYNWDSWKPQNLPKGVPFWPMLHDANKTGNWLATCKKGYAQVALGMNEPDHPGQANMSPKQGAAIWRKYMLPLKKNGYYLISPAVTSTPSGLQWLKSWKKECPSCWKSLDGVALHYYGKSATDFKNYMDKMHKALGKPIHITETACEDFSPNKCSPKQASDYLKAVTSWAMKTDYVRSIFYFGLWPQMPGGVAQSNSLMDSKGRPNALGKKYLTY